MRRNGQMRKLMDFDDSYDFNNVPTFSDHNKFGLKEKIE